MTTVYEPLAARRARRIPGWLHAPIVVTLLMAAVVAVTVSLPHPERVLRGENDFLQLYSGAAMVGTNGLYSVEASRRTQLERTGLWLQDFCYFRLPFYAALLRPLASLPYLHAYWLFQAINLFSCGLFAHFFLLKRYPAYVVWLPLFLPLHVALMNGQDVMLVTLFCALSLVLAGRGRDLAAGACLSLCLIKFHLFAFVPLALLAHRRWRILLGGIAGSAFWISLSFAAGGAGWPVSYTRLLVRPDMHPAQDRMPAVLGVLRSFEVAQPVAALLVVALAVLFVWAMFKVKNLEASVGLALIAGVISSVHAYPQDCTLLLIAVPILSVHSVPSLTLRALLLTPLPYLATFSGRPWNVVLPAALVAFSAVAVFDVMRRNHVVSPLPAASPGRAEPLESAI